MEAELTVDQMADLFNQEEEAKFSDDGAQEATPANEDEILAQDDPDLEIDAEEAAEGPSGDDVEDEGGEEVEGPIQAPEFWSSEYKERFANLPPEAQKLVAEQAKHGSVAVSKALNGAANSRKTAETEAKSYSQRIAELDQLLPQVKQNFVSRWGNVSPEQWAQAMQVDPVETMKAKALYDAEVAQLQKLEAHKAKAEVEAFSQYQQAEASQLLELAKSDDIAKRLAGSDDTARKATGQYLLSLGFTPDRLKGIGAMEMVIAHKASLYDKLKAEQKTAKAAPKPAPQNSPAPRMRAPTTSGKPQYVSKLDQVKSKAVKSGSINDFAMFFDMEAKAKK